MKALKIIVITLVILGGLIYLGIWYGFRTTSEDVSHLKPFSEVIGKELKTVQTCFISVNYKHWVKENSHILIVKQSELSDQVKNLQKLAIGTTLKIKEAKRYRNGVTGFKATYLLGSVFVESYQEEVDFEFAWGRKNYGTSLPGDYFSYSLAPWQEVPLDTMYNYDEDIAVPLENYNNTK